MPHRRRSCLRLVLLILIIIGSVSPPAVRTQTRDPRLDWWREARFGLFIHWGLYAVPAGALARRK
jgi:alpha-L-fucosidase